MPPDTSLVWFRRDLRLDDNPAWAEATCSSDAVAAVFVLDPVPWERAGQHRRDLLVADLRSLHESLRARGGGLHLIPGDPAAEVPALVDHLGASRVHVNADVGTYATARDSAVAARLGADRLQSHWGNHVHPPGSITARSTGEVHRVFTPFHRAWAATEPPPWPEPGAARLIAPGSAPGFPDVSDIGIPCGEAGAENRLRRWTEEVDDYEDTHDRPALETGTSRLSADLRFGTISARHVLEVVGDSAPGRRAFVRQLAWRDWYAHLFHLEPRLARHAMDPRMDRIDWNRDRRALTAWQQGRTGYPMVDAGMRQLAATGWMHNRVRMVTASFLVKDLLIDWREGESHFRRELIDYELTQNVGNWQWVAGTGPDAAPYFRILNPVTQSERFDPDGAYIRRWVPELAELRSASIHSPWTATPLELLEAGVVLGEDYPLPMVDHAAARQRTLQAYDTARSSG